jgi:predicted nucleotidyltransferase
LGPILLVGRQAISLIRRRACRENRPIDYKEKLIMTVNVLSKLQRQALEEAAAEAAKWECIAAIGIFGSVARGDERSNSDIDVAMDYVPNWPQSSDFSRWQPRALDWAEEAGKRLGRVVRIAGLHPRDDTNTKAYRAYAAARNEPIACKGKAKIVPTKRYKPQPAAHVPDSTSGHAPGRDKD